MSDYLYCSKCHNTSFEVLTSEYRDTRIFFFECTNPNCRWTAVVEGKYIMEQPASTEEPAKK